MSCILTGRAKMKNNSDNINFWKGSEETGSFINFWWECKMAQLLWETVLQFLQKWHMQLPHDLAIYIKEIGVYVHTKTYRRMFTKVLFVTTKNWTQSRCPSKGGWFNKL